MSGDRPFDPFGRGDRTIIRPNPGGRRAAPMPAAPPAQGQTPYTPSPMPSSAPGDDWVSAAARPAPASPQQSRGNEPPPQLAPFRRSELDTPNESPIMRAAGPLLLLLGRLRANIVRTPSVPLMEQVGQSIQDFELELRNLGFPAEQVRVAKYALCATADDIVQNMPVEDRHIWTQYSMLSRFFGERIGGVRFFEELDRAKADPIVNYPILELMHACLALGFEGIHRTTAGGAAILQQIQRTLYDTLRRVKPRVTDEISPRWRGQSIAANPGRYRIPVWAVASVVSVLLLAFFITLRTLLGGRSEIVAAALLGIFPGGEIALERVVPVPPPPPPPPPKPTPERQLTQLERVRLGLAEEIKANKVNADQTANEIIVTINNLVLFDSGKAEVRGDFKPIGAKIAATLDKEPGFLKVVGHSDSTPIKTVRFPSNYELSVARAQSVADLLKPLLKQPDRLKVEGKGADAPIASNATPEGKARNRRVEIMIPRED
jgi:type VI secretion system protein ImpK